MPIAYRLWSDRITGSGPAVWPNDGGSQIPTGTDSGTPPTPTAGRTTAYPGRVGSDAGASRTTTRPFAGAAGAGRAARTVAAVGAGPGVRCRANIQVQNAGSA